MKRIIRTAVVYLLTVEAKAVLKKYKPRIVAITGSVGKTSTKDSIQTVLSRFYDSRANVKSFNSEFGVPLTILGLPNQSRNLLGWIKNLIEGLSLIFLPNHYPEWLVLEMGADAPGDIASLTAWVKPEIVVVTKLSKVPVHVEFFANPEDLFREKGNLVKALKPGGTLILNADDEDVVAYRNLSEEKVILFGNGNGSDVVSRNYEIVYDAYGTEKDAPLLPKGIKCTIEYKDESEQVYLEGTVGAHHAYHALAAFAVCAALSEPFSIAAKSFKHHAPTPGRLRLIEGIKHSIILDDTYNSSPVAAEEALKALFSINTPGKKIAVLGDMLELGRYSIDEHKKIGILAAEADMLVTVGIRSRYTASFALDAGMDENNVLQFEDAKEAGAYLQNMIKEGDAILVKGSQSMRMERAVEEIMCHPEDKEKLLVRQDEEWQKRG
ncbi:MAG: UDP-N-acetylmuramoylalanyl-D-glutamyl-2,6-diaminopimelate--D-alanyl-D-alanyl ligase [Parcubacteria group bacterium]|nr:UDP-N-acetylmuramoylalanyl-D-glutamyl-2,6-diaminopimelate--D-alanyl-D-alanyl ligase [Parcubacteria group bacterium]